MYDEDEWAERVERFADPGGSSALHPSSRSNPRNLPCPNCNWPNRLTPRDAAKGYQCDACAEAQERGWDIEVYVNPDDDDYRREAHDDGLTSDVTDHFTEHDWRL